MPYVDKAFTPIFDSKYQIFDQMPRPLCVRIFIKKHDVFKRKGADLFMEKKITLLEALTGTNFDVKHLDGANLKVATSPGEIINNNEV